MNRRGLYPIAVWSAWMLGLPLLCIALGAVVLGVTEPHELPLDHPRLWWIGAAGPLAGVTALYGVARRRKGLHRFVSPALAGSLTARVRPVRQAGRAGLFVLAMTMLAIAILGPRWGTYVEKQTVRGIDIVVALDVSRSMYARDVAPNRIERVKREIRQQLIERDAFSGANRLALLAFAGSTSLKVPLTTDHLSLRARIEAIDVGSAPRGGTAIAEAIRAGADLLERSPPEATKVIILFTDGEDHLGGPVEVAESVYKERNVLVYTVGVGDPARTFGAEVPESADPGAKPLIHDGQIVFSRLDEPGLRAIAEAGSGRYAPVRNLYQLVNDLTRLHDTELTVQERQRHKPRYQWFVAIALTLLGWETVLRERAPGVESLPERVWAREAPA